jgi:hypothetical protein
VASSSSAAGNVQIGTAHHLTAFTIDPATGALNQIGDPLRLPVRPIHMTLDNESQHILVAFNSPSSLRVYRIRKDFTPGEEVLQSTMDAGIYAHQVRVTPDGRHVVEGLALMRPRRVPHLACTTGGVTFGPAPGPTAGAGGFGRSCSSASPATPATRPPSNAVVPSIFRRLIRPSGVFDDSSDILPPHPGLLRPRPQSLSITFDVFRRYRSGLSLPILHAMPVARVHLLPGRHGQRITNWQVNWPKDYTQGP